MDRRKAWNGFYKTLREIKQYEKIAKEQGHDCGIRTKRQMAEMRARRYAYSLVFEHGWQDVHTARYCRVWPKGQNPYA